MNGLDWVLIERELTLGEVRQLVEQKCDSLSKYLGRYGEPGVVAEMSLEKARVFRHNYQSIIGVVNKERKNVNNFSMHLLLTLSLYYRALHMPLEAKEALKKSLSYVGNPFSDPALQAICLNNFANYYKGRGKFWKCLKYSLKGVEILQTHLHESRGRCKQEKQELAILLVVLLIHAKNCSSRIMKTHESKHLKQYFEFVNYLGYKTCSKYLGKDSVFNQFVSTEPYFHLPVFKTEETHREVKEKENPKEAEIVNQLEKIYEILKAKQSPEFVVINTQSNIAEPRLAELNQSEQSIFINNQINEVIIQERKPEPQKTIILPPPIPPPHPVPTPLPLPAKEEKKEESIIEQLFRPLMAVPEEMTDIPRITINQQEIENEISHHYIPSSGQEDSDSEESLPPLVMAEETISINKWEIKLRLEKERDQRVGNLVLECSNKKQVRKEVILEEKLEKISCQINREDKLSYEILNDELVEEEFIEHCIKPFFSITDQGKMSIHPRSSGLIQPFQIRFLNQESLVFLNHIRNNLFRVAISPAYSCKSLYLNVELAQSTMVEYFSFEEETMDFINAIFKSISNAPSASAPLTIKDKTKLCKVVNEFQLLRYIQQIISEFENSLLNREDETAVNEIIENELLYYKYEEIKKGRLGIYYFIRYLPSINYFDIYLKNNYETYSIDGKIKSRGNALYKARDFLGDFGIPLKASKNNLFAYIEIIAKKYYLLTFDKPLTESDSDRYVENAILELPITENCFKTQLFPRENYFIPITISLLTINSETPVGIKVIEYDPISCRNRGFFIHIVANEWVRPYRKPAITINNILFHTYINEFPFRNEYFLPEWLEKSGFATLFEKIMDPTSPLYLEHNINRLVRGKILIRIFNNEDST